MSDTAPTYTQRQVKVSGIQIPVDSSLLYVPVEELRNRLRATYPEVVNATPRVFEKEGVQFIEWIPVGQRKG